MNIIYASNACDDVTYNNEILSEKNLSFQAQKFNSLIIKGMAQSVESIDVISGRPINHIIHPIKYYAKKTVAVGNICYNYCGFFNYKYIRQLMLFINTMRIARRIVSSKTEMYMVCDVLNYSTSLAAMNACKRKNIKIVGVVTDLPEFLSGKQKTIQMLDKLIDNCDAYVILAEKMNEKINKANKPYVVIEGFADSDMSQLDNALENKYDKKVVLYSGALSKKYGLETLVQGFIDANVLDSELHLYGLGDYVPEIMKIIETNDSIKYFGCMPNEVVVGAQMRATLLVNPRFTNEEFVHYSFPSKNIEYVASGTPMLTTNLPSMPEEYKEFCYVLDDESSKGVAEAIKNILSKPDIEVHELGSKAKAWVLDTKNNNKQSKKIIDLIKSLK